MLECMKLRLRGTAALASLVLIATPACGDGDDGSTDTTGSTTDGGPLCGNGHLDPGEACDDGNVVDTDSCVAGCALAICGDCSRRP